MSKKQVVAFILITLVLSLLVNIFFGRQLAAKMSTWPVFSRWHLLSPQAPIVIERVQEVRFSESTDYSQAAASTKNRLSAVAVMTNGKLVVTGTALNATSDGTFVSVAGTFSQPGAAYFVVANDGRTAAISDMTVDAQSGLVFFKAALRELPLASFSLSDKMSPGQRVFVLGAGLESAAIFSPAFLARPETATEGKNYPANQLSRAFELSPNSGYGPGYAAADFNSDIAGIWNGSGFVPADIIKSSLSAYLANPAAGKAAWGFGYEIVKAPEAEILKISPGLRVTEVVKNSAAEKAGLKVGDIVKSLNGSGAADMPLPETFLQRLKVGDKLSLSVARQGQTLEISYNLAAAASKN